MSLPTDLQALITQSELTTSFVVDEFGEVANEMGTSNGIGNTTDKKLLGALRANSEIVLTSGKTARADRYRMPKTADLAIFTRHGVPGLTLEPKPGQQLIIIGPEQASGFAEALEYLGNIGFHRIHVEFGPLGFRAVRALLDLFLVSGTKESGIASFCKRHQLEAKQRFELDDLFVWAC